MTVTLLRLEKGTYKDQHGFEHKCFYAKDEVEVTRTEDFDSYEYYGTIRDYYWDSEDGQRFRCHTATDFGCPNTWSRRVNGERQDEKWVLDRRQPDKPHHYYGTPIIVDF